MKKHWPWILGAVILAAGAWWFFIGRNIGQLKAIELRKQKIATAIEKAADKGGHIIASLAGVATSTSAKSALTGGQQIGGTLSK